jgi:hypothetical protein
MPFISNKLSLMPNPLQNMLNFLFGFRSKMSGPPPPPQKKKEKQKQSPSPGRVEMKVDSENIHFHLGSKKRNYY